MVILKSHACISCVTIYSCHALQFSIPVPEWTDSLTVTASGQACSALSWQHYNIIMRILRFPRHSVGM